MKDSRLFIMPFVQDTFLSFDSSLSLAVMSMLKTVMDGKIAARKNKKLNPHTACFTRHESYETASH